MKYKNTEPKKDIEYIFQFKPNGPKHRLQYVGVRPNGRLEFYNLTYKTFTSMTAERFSFNYRFRLKYKKPIVTAVQQEIKLPIEERIVVSNVTPAPAENTGFVAVITEFINDIKKFTSEQNARFTSVTGFNPDHYVAQLKSAIHNYNNGVKSAYQNGLIMKLCDIFNKCDIKIG